MANFFGGTLNSMAGGVGQISVAATSAVYRATIPGLSDLGLPGRLLFSYGFMVYLAIVLAVVLQLFLNRTRPGLNLRSVGENPATADAAGINVSRNKYLATCVGAGISGLGGLYYTMDYIKGTWANDGTIESLGWLAVALVIFATWRTVNAIWGSYLFGLLFWVYLIIPGLGRRDTYLFNMLPYLVTIAVLIFVSAEQEGESAPASLAWRISGRNGSFSPYTRALRAKSRGALFVCSLLRLVVPGCGEDIAHQHGPGHGPHAAGHRSDVGCLGFYRGEVYIAAEPALAVPVHGHVDDHGPFLHHTRRDKTHPAHSGHQDVRLPGDGRQSRRLGVADRHGAVLLEQQHGHGLAHDIAAAQHHAPPAPDGDAVFPQHLHDAGRGAWQKHRITDHCRAAHVIGVEAIHVLVLGDGVQHRLRPDARAKEAGTGCRPPAGRG